MCRVMWEYFGDLSYFLGAFILKVNCVKLDANDVSFSSESGRQVN